MMLKSPPPQTGIDWLSFDLCTSAEDIDMGADAQTCMDDGDVKRKYFLWGCTPGSVLTISSIPGDWSFGALKKALTKGCEVLSVPTFERLILSNPAKLLTAPNVVPSYMGWLIFNNDDDARTVSGKLENFEIKDPDPVKQHDLHEVDLDIPQVATPMKAFRIRMQACTGVSPRVLSSEFREVQNVENALNMCLSISARFDSECGITEGLRNIVENNLGDQSLFVKLDACVAYLRSVHFFQFYSMKKYRSEGEMWQCDMAVFCRKPLTHLQDEKETKIFKWRDLDMKRITDFVPQDTLSADENPPDGKTLDVFEKEAKFLEDWMEKVEKCEVDTLEAFFTKYILKVKDGDDDTKVVCGLHSLFICLSFLCPL
jgi:hypothetical protein